METTEKLSLTGNKFAVSELLLLENNKFHTVFVMEKKNNIPNNRRIKISISLLRNVMPVPFLISNHFRNCCILCCKSITHGLAPLSL